MDRLAAGDWAEPIDIPALNLNDWPMGAECSAGSAREDDHPILAWANANPDRLQGIDLRGELDDYKKTIIEFLKNPPKPVVKTTV